MVDITYSTRAVGSGFTAGWVRNKFNVTLDDARLGADGRRPQIVTHIRGSIAGNGASRSVRMYFGSSSKTLTVAAAGAAVDTGWEDSSNWALPDGGSGRFGYDDLSGSCFFGRSSSSGTSYVEGAFGDFTGRLGFSYRYIESASAPGIETLYENDGELTIVLAAPSSTGGSAVTGYRIQYSTTPEFDLGTVATVESSGVTVLVGLEPGVKYYFRACARNGVTDTTSVLGGPWSPPAFITMPTIVAGRMRNAADNGWLNVEQRIRSEDGLSWLNAEGRIRNAANTAWLELG